MSVIDDIFPSSPLSNSNLLIKAFARHVGDMSSLSVFTQGGFFQHLTLENIPVLVPWTGVINDLQSCIADRHPP